MKINKYFYNTLTLEVPPEGEGLPEVEGPPEEEHTHLSFREEAQTMYHLKSFNNGSELSYPNEFQIDLPNILVLDDGNSPSDTQLDNFLTNRDDVKLSYKIDGVNVLNATPLSEVKTTPSHEKYGNDDPYERRIIGIKLPGYDLDLPHTIQITITIESLDPVALAENLANAEAALATDESNLELQTAKNNAEEALAAAEGHFHESKINVFTIPKNFMLNEEGTDSNKKLLIFRKADIDDVFGVTDDINTLIKIKQPRTVPVSTNFKFADKTVTVGGDEYFYANLPANWNEGFDDAENFWKIYDEYSIKFKNKEVYGDSSYYPYIWVYRRLPNIVADSGKEKKFGSNLISSESTQPEQKYPPTSKSHFLKYKAKKGTGTGSTFMTSSRYGLVEWIIDESDSSNLNSEQKDALKEKKYGSFTVNTTESIEAIKYKVKFHRYSKSDGEFELDYRITSSDETFDISVLKNLGKYYSKDGSPFRLPSNFDDVPVGDITVVDSDDNEKTGLVTAEGSFRYISILDDMVDKDFVISAPGLNLELHIYQDVTLSLILRYDDKSKVELNFDDYDYEDVIMEEISIAQSDQAIDITLSGKEVSNTIATLKRKKGSSDIAKTSDKYSETYTKALTFLYSFEKEHEISSGKTITIKHYKYIKLNVILVFDYTIEEPFVIKYFEPDPIGATIQDWGETDVMKKDDTKGSLQDGYFVDLNPAKVTEIKKYLPIVKPPTYSKSETSNKSPESLYSFIMAPSNGLIAKFTDPDPSFASLKEPKTFRERIFRFDGDKFLYYIDITVEVEPLCFESINDVLIYLPNISNYTPTLTDDCDQDSSFIQTINDKSTLVQNIHNIERRGSYDFNYTTKITKNEIVFIANKTFTVYVYDDINEKLALDLCQNEVKTTSNIINDDINIDVFRDYELSLSEKIELNYIRTGINEELPLIFNTSVSTLRENLTETVVVNPVGYNELYQGPYNINYNYSVTENPANSPFQEYWKKGKERIYHTDSSTVSKDEIKKYLEKILKPVGIMVYRTDLIDDEITYSVTLQKNCDNCEGLYEYDASCFTNREIKVYKYNPNKTLILCKDDTFDSDLKSQIKSYGKKSYQVSYDTPLAEYKSTLREDINHDEFLNNDDWLIIRNNVEGPPFSRIGVWNESTTAVDHLWKTTSIIFKSVDNYESTITYNITLISDIKQCKVVRLGKHKVQNKLPEIIGTFLKDSSNTQGLEISDDVINLDDEIDYDDSYKLDQITFTNVNDKSYDVDDVDVVDAEHAKHIENVKSIKGLLKIEDTSADRSFSKKPDTEINYIYHLHHGGKTVELIYKVTILVNRLAKYVKLPVVTIGKPYEYEFTSEVLAENTSICNIFCLPKGLSWDGEKTISGTIECAKPTETCTVTEIDSKSVEQCYDCPVKITLEIAAPENDEEEGKCECIGQSSACNDSCTYLVDGGVNCTNYDTQDYFLFIKNPENDEVGPELKQKDVEEDVSEPTLVGELDDPKLLSITVKASSESLNLNNYITNTDKEIRFVSGTLINDGTLTLPEENDGGDTDQIVISAQYKNRNCEYVEFGKIVVNVEHEPITNIIKKSQLSKGIQNVLENNPALLYGPLGGAFYTIES